MRTRAPRRRVWPIRLRFARLATGASAVVWLAACGSDFDTSRTIPVRGTLGAELFGVLCDRVGGQSLHEDLTGASFRDICHKRADDTYADKVDTTALPALVDMQPDVDGNPVPLAKQTADRAYGVARMETLARHRADLIPALDATFPDIQVPIKDLANADPTLSCAPPAASGEGSLHTELSNLLGRFQDLYVDGTLPRSSEAIARVVDAFKAAPDAQAAWAVYNARAGYRPMNLALGAARPVVAYPGLRDFTNATLKILSADSDPYDPTPQRDAKGNRIAVPGSAYPQLTRLLEVAHAELLTSTADPPLAPLAVTPDPQTGRSVLSRPRSDLEALGTLFFAQDPMYGGGEARYIVQRDARGYVVVPKVGGNVPPPFVDRDNDGLPDVDALGDFVTSTGQPAPSPFLAIGAPPALARDTFARALNAPGGQLVFGYLDTSHTYTASLVQKLGALVDPNPADKHETLMDVLAGVRVLLGARDGSAATTKTYSDGTSVAYDAFHTDTSPLIDFIYALGQTMADPTTDDTLSFAKTIVEQHPNDVARLVGDGLYDKSLADQDTTARLPPASTLWDDLIDVTVKIAQEPGLLEDVLRAFANDATPALAGAFGNYMTYKDRISYQRANLNGLPWNMTTNDASAPKTPVDRSQPDTGANRSEFQRFLQLIHDNDGVSACNKEGAVVHAAGTTLGNLDLPSDGNLVVRIAYGSKMSFHECEVFKIDDMAKLYVDAIVGAGNLVFRDKFMTSGVLGIGAATVSTIEGSSAIGYDPSNADTFNGPDLSKPGFWDKSDSKSFRPKPGWLDRLVFFDQVNDSPTAGSGPNYQTNRFLRDLQGPYFGTSVCPERVIDDPCVTSSSCSGASDIAPDKKVHLRACPDGDWFQQRDPDMTFIFEEFGFYNAVAPLVNAFITANNPVTMQPRRREDLFVALMEALHKRWQDGAGTADECLLGIDPSTGSPISCAKDGVVSYEPLLAKIFSSDTLAAVHDLLKTVEGIQLPTCAVSDPLTHLCTTPGPTIDGISILANSTRALVDPDRAKAAGLTDRHGNVTSQRNDGTTNPQVTPLYLVLQALNGIDQAFAQYAQAHPQDAGRQAQWRRARSQLVDTFLSVNGQNTPTQSFADPSLPKILPVLIDLARSQLTAHCPPPYKSCTWASHDLWTNANATMSGPLFATTMDVQEAIRLDDAARTETEKLLSYLVDAASTNDALSELLASANDLIQVMRDDANLVPLYHVLATAALPSQTDAQGNVQPGVIDSTTAPLARVSGRALDANGSGSEICAKELDPNNVLNLALAHLVTPMQGLNGAPGETPLEVILDAVSDVNRQSPGAAAKLTGSDYANTANELSEFLLDPQRGLEQFYEIVRQGIVH
jgi:hypothetical protein